MRDKLGQFIRLLQGPLPLEQVFNPWQDVDPEHELGHNGPQIRTRQLHHYLECRLNQAEFLLIGEALGYQGGHFSGIAMTSERILLGHQRDRGILPTHVLPNLAPQRTSKPELKSKGFTEPTATIVWQKLADLCDSPLQFVLWNAFAWHPFNTKKGFLSNRKPKKLELAHGTHVLRHFLDLFPQAKRICVGNVAFEQLSRMDIPHHRVRHPAQGGAEIFRLQLSELFRKG
jgi:hypothetical protein